LPDVFLLFGDVHADLQVTIIGFHVQITEDFEEVQVQSRGFGILDVGYRSQVFHCLI
jgi:hypothetical protein